MGQLRTAAENPTTVPRRPVEVRTPSQSFLLAERGSPGIPAPATGSPDPARAVASASLGFRRLGGGRGGRGPEPEGPESRAVRTSTKFPCPPPTRDPGPRSPELQCLPQPSGRIPLRATDSVTELSCCKAPHHEPCFQQEERQNMDAYA